MIATLGKLLFLARFLVLCNFKINIWLTQDDLYMTFDTAMHFTVGSGFSGLMWYPYAILGKFNFGMTPAPLHVLRPQQIALHSFVRVSSDHN